jgi:hypothetical protein
MHLRGAAAAEQHHASFNSMQYADELARINGRDQSSDWVQLDESLRCSTAAATRQQASANNSISCMRLPQQGDTVTAEGRCQLMIQLLR